MKVFCGIFAFVFGLTGFSCFFNLAMGRYPSPPLDAGTKTFDRVKATYNLNYFQ